MNGLWVPTPPPGYGFMPVAPAPILTRDKPKGKLGFDPSRIVVRTAAPAPRNSK